MRRGLTSWQATSASSSLGCRQGATALLRGGSALPFTSSIQHNLLQSRCYAAQVPNDQTKQKGNKPTKEENKQRSRQKRIKRLLRDDESWDTYVTAENMAEQLKYDKGLVDFTLKKNEEDSPHAKEFAYSATGETLSYDTLAEKLGLVSVNFRLGQDHALHLAALLKEIKELEFDYSGKVVETVHQNSDLTAEEKEWFTRFPELSGELDETFLSVANKRLISILREIPQEETGSREQDTKKEDRNAGRELFKFAEGKEVYVGGHFEFSPEELTKYLPEGFSGTLTKLNFTLMEDKHTLLRTRTYSIIKELARRHRTNFLGASGKKSMILDGPAGSGKSTALNQIVMWARMNDWLVVWIPDAEAMVGGESLEESKMERGHYYESDIQLQIAQNLLKAHSDKLAKINLKNKFKIKGFNSADNTLKDLLKHLTENEELSDECMYWFRRELNRVTEYPVLIAVDGYNHFYHWSDFYNPEDSARYRPRTLRSQKLTTAKWFSGHQDHGLVNGTMVCALRASTPLYSYWEQNGRNCCVTIPNYDKEEFGEVVTHFREKEWVPEEMTNFTASYLYALADGNPREVFKLCGAT